tara:strand:+ start:287 stop:475 length:189 start_codon:yes stop_codon:yes gene_type:complete
VHAAQGDDKKDSYWEHHRENIEPAEQKLLKLGTPSKLGVGELRALIQSASKSKTRGKGGVLA